MECVRPEHKGETIRWKYEQVEKVSYSLYANSVTLEHWVVGFAWDRPSIALPFPPPTGQGGDAAGEERARRRRLVWYGQTDGHPPLLGVREETRVRMCPQRRGIESVTTSGLTHGGTTPEHLSYSYSTLPSQSSAAKQFQLNALPRTPCANTRNGHCESEDLIKKQTASRRHLESQGHRICVLPPCMNLRSELGSASNFVPK